MVIPAPVETPRFLGLDVHRQSITVAGVDKEQQIVLRPRRVSLGEFADWAKTYLTPTDVVVLEATSNAWTRLRPASAFGGLSHGGAPWQSAGKSHEPGQDRSPRCPPSRSPLGGGPHPSSLGTASCRA